MEKFKGLPQDVYNNVCEHLENLNQNEEIIVWINKKETKEIRTIRQNSMFYGLFGEIAKAMGEEITGEMVKQYLLIGCFGSKTIKLSKIECDVPLIPHTSDLTKQQAIFFIDTMMKFIEKHNIPCTYSSLQFKNLIETYDTTN